MQAMAAHESPHKTKLYDRTKERLTQDEVERIRLQEGRAPRYRAGALQWIEGGTIAATMLAPIAHTVSSRLGKNITRRYAVR